MQSYSNSPHFVEQFSCMQPSPPCRLMLSIGKIPKSRLVQVMEPIDSVFTKQPFWSIRYSTVITVFTDLLCARAAEEINISSVPRNKKYGQFTQLPVKRINYYRTRRMMLSRCHVQLVFQLKYTEVGNTFCEYYVEKFLVIDLFGKRTWKMDSDLGLLGNAPELILLL